MFFQKDLAVSVVLKLEEPQLRVSAQALRKCGESMTNKVVGFQHGLEKASQWDPDDTRVLFLTEGIIMRQAMKTPDINSPYSVIDGCAVLMLDEVHSGSSDMELILAAIPAELTLSTTENTFDNRPLFSLV